MSHGTQVDAHHGLEGGRSMTCALCGHDSADNWRCGSASASENGQRVFLCHADDHSCYVEWTLYGRRT